MKDSEVVSQLLPIVINGLCFVFVLYQTSDCFTKYINEPHSTDVQIEESTSHRFPSVTMCYNDVSFYEETLKSCNFTYDQYFYDHKWVGNGTADYCKDPKMLWNKMTKIQDLIYYVKAESTDTKTIKYFGNESNFHFVDTWWMGRCLSFTPPKDFNLFQIEAEFSTTSYIYIHNYGAYFAGDYSEVHLNVNKDLYISINLEIFDSTDNCFSYDKGEDSCLNDAVNEVSFPISSFQENNNTLLI